MLPSFQEFQLVSLLGSARGSGETGWGGADADGTGGGHEATERS